MRKFYLPTAGLAVLCAASPVSAADLVTGYSTPGDKGRVAGIVALCPSTDGSNTAVACPATPGSSPAAPSTITDPAELIATTSTILPLGTAGATLALTNTTGGTMRVAISGLTGSGATISFQASDTPTSALYPVGALNGAANARLTAATVDGSYTFSVPARSRVVLTVTTAGTGTATVQSAVGQQVGSVVAEQGNGPWTVAPPGAVHTTAAQITIAAGGSAVVLAAGKIATGCDIVSSGAYVWAYTTAAAPGTATASATTGLPLSAGQSYHCPTPAITQGLSIYNPGSAAITIGADSY